VISEVEGGDTLSSRDVRVVCPRPNVSHAQYITTILRGEETEKAELAVSLQLCFVLEKY